MHPYAHTLMPLDLAKRMIEQRGGAWRIELGPFLEIMRNGQHLGSALIADDTVRFLDITRALAAPQSCPNTEGQTMTKCFSCDRTIKAMPRVLTCLDEQTVHVGPCCFAKTENAGLDGYQPPKGGPRLYTLEAKARLLACDCQHPEPTIQGFAAISVNCPVHGY